MAISVHLLLIGVVAAFTAACLAARGGWANRPLLTALLAALPTWLIGATCMLLLSARGAPTIEWLIPTVCMLLIGVWCRSESLFRLARWAMPIVALALCINFWFVLESGYTASAQSDAIAAAKQKTLLVAAAKELRNGYPADESFPAGAVSELLPDTRVGELTVTSRTREWHTPLTRLYRIEQAPAVVWYPGGAVGDVELEIKAR